MSAAALVRAMSAAGAPPEAIALALEEIERLQNADADRRAKARDKKRRQRVVDCPETVPGQSRDMGGTVPTQAPPAPAPSFPPDPQTNPTPTHPDIISTPAHDAHEAAGSAKPKPRWPKAYPPPPGVPDDAWAGLIEHRIRRRAAMTPRAYELLVKRLAQLACDEWPPGRLVDLIVERNWLTVEASWLPRTENRNGHHRPHDDRRSGWAARPGMEGIEPASLDDDDPRRAARC